MQSFVAIDTETECIESGCLAPRLVCLSWHEHGTGKDPQLAGHKTASLILKGYLAAGWTIVGHNVAFDFGVLIAHDLSLLEHVFAAYRADRVHDTMIREKLLAIASGRLKISRFDLGTLAQKYLGVALDKSEDGWRLRYGDLMHTPLDEWPFAARDYATADAASTLRVFLAQAPDGALVSPDEHLQVRAAWALHLAGLWGLRTDGEAVASLRAELEAERAGHLARLEGTDVFRLEGKRKPKRVRDTKAIRARVEAGFAAQDLPPPITAKGNVQYDEDTLRQSGDAVLELLADMSYGDKLLTTFVPVLERGTRQPIIPRWNVLVETGRTSCSSWDCNDSPEGANIQNLPRKGGVRECFVPRPGHLYVSADYDTLELRALAQVLLAWFGGSEMATALRAGRDLHLDLASQILGIRYEQALAQKGAGDLAVLDTRQFAKIANFGFPGGLGADAFVRYARSNGADITPLRAAELRAAWFARWPEMRLYFRRISEMTGDLASGDVTQFRSGRVRGRCTFTQAANGFFQGLAADGAKEALWQVAWKCYCDKASALYGSRPVAFLHDEIMLETPEALASRAGDALSKIMNAAMARWITDVPITSEPRIMRRWHKGAKAVRDAQGRLQIWEPPCA